MILRQSLPLSVALPQIGFFFSLLLKLTNFRPRPDIQIFSETETFSPFAPPVHLRTAFSATNMEVFENALETEIFKNGDLSYSFGRGFFQIRRKKTPLSKISGYLWTVF